MGQDLLQASIAVRKQGRLEFTITVTALPTLAGPQDVPAYGWMFTTGDKGSWFALRGPQQAETANGEFQFELQRCAPEPGTVGYSDACEVVDDNVRALIDEARTSLVIPVSLEVLDARRGTRIGAYFGEYGAYEGNVTAAPFGSVASTDGKQSVGDALVADRVFVVP